MILTRDVGGVAKIGCSMARQPCNDGCDADTNDDGGADVARHQDGHYLLNAQQQLSTRLNNSRTTLCKSSALCMDSCSSPGLTFEVSSTQEKGTQAGSHEGKKGLHSSSTAGHVILRELTSQA